MKRKGHRITQNGLSVLSVHVSIFKVQAAGMRSVSKRRIAFAIPFALGTLLGNPGVVTMDASLLKRLGQPTCRFISCTCKIGRRVSCGISTRHGQTEPIRAAPVFSTWGLLGAHSPCHSPAATGQGSQLRALRALFWVIRGLPIRGAAALRQIDLFCSGFPSWETPWSLRTAPLEGPLGAGRCVVD